MTEILPFLGLLSAFWWSVSGGILKSVRINTVLIFPFTESVISLFVIVFLTLIGRHWVTFFEYSLETYLYLFGGSVVSMLGTLCYVAGIRKISLGIVFTISTSIVMVLTILLDQFFNRISFNQNIIVGAFLIIVGTIIINGLGFGRSPIKSINTNYFAGTVVSIFAGVFWGSGIFMNDRGLIESGVLFSTFTRTLVPVFLLGIFLFIKKPINVKQITVSDRKLILLAAFFTTIAMFFWHLSLKSNSASLTAILSSTSPVFAILIGLSFYGEKFKLNQIIGIMFCFAGTFAILLNRWI